MKNLNKRKKYDFELRLKKISIIRSILGYSIFIGGICISMTIFLIIPGSIIGAIGFKLTRKEVKCPNCNKRLRVKKDDMMVHCKKCHENINIVWE